ncbi:MAG: methyltransferase domain-containing protein [Armatimonadota bacterium]
MCRLCLRLRLRGRWALIAPGNEARADRPGPELSRRLADWLRGPRSRALRRAGIGRRERVLEVGCGHGVVTVELVRRARGDVVAVDRLLPTGPHRRSPREANGSALLAAADARNLPFADAAFDLVFFQNTLMWIDPAGSAVREAARVLRPDGALVALEPDYGGMIEEPDLGLRVIWLDALERAGADPLTGRKLPGLLEDAGLYPWVEFAHIPRPAETEALDLLAELPLTVLQRERTADARRILEAASGDWSVFLHVPWVMVVAGHRKLGHLGR